MDFSYTKSWRRGRFHFLLHRELQVKFGWNRILSTQRVGGGVVCIFFYTESCFYGGDAIENDDFHRVKQRLQGSIFFYGGDAIENDDFQRVKQRLQGSNFFLWGRCD